MRFLIAAMTWLALVVPSAARERVDLLLVLALDVSGSMSSWRWDVQRQGYARALQDPDVIHAIRLGRHNKIAVAVVQWSAALQQDLSIGWTVIGDAKSANKVAARFEAMERQFWSDTSISGALRFSAKLFEHAPFASERRVIDISGDGFDTEEMVFSRQLLEPLRRSVIESGIVINGLPINSERPFVAKYIEEYYREHVIGGQGSFVEFVENGDDLEAFVRALKKKLLREILADARR